MVPKCTVCEEELVYDGNFAAPGFGQSWVCPRCKTPHRKHGQTLENLHQTAMDDLDMDPRDIA